MRNLCTNRQNGIISWTLLLPVLRILAFIENPRKTFRSFSTFVFRMRSFAFILLSCFTTCLCTAVPNNEPSKLEVRQSSTSVPAPPLDLGYGVYQGYYNATSQLNIYKGLVHLDSSLEGSSQSLINSPLLSITNEYQNSICRTTNRDSQMAETTSTSRESKPDDHGNCISFKMPAG